MFGKGNAVSGEFVRILSVRMLGSVSRSVGPLVPSIVGLLTITRFFFGFLLGDCNHTVNA